jgi:dTDP-glucose 4,6-dehydratase
VDTAKLKALGWRPQADFEEGLRDTVEWYRAHESWWRPIKEQNPAFAEHYRRHYRG